MFRNYMEKLIEMNERRAIVVSVQFPNATEIFCNCWQYTFNGFNTIVARSSKWKYREISLDW